MQNVSESEISAIITIESTKAKGILMKNITTAIYFILCTVTLFFNFLYPDSLFSIISYGALITIFLIAVAVKNWIVRRHISILCIAA